MVAQVVGGFNRGELILKAKVTEREMSTRVRSG